MFKQYQTPNFLKINVLKHSLDKIIYFNELKLINHEFNKLKLIICVKVFKV